MGRHLRLIAGVALMLALPALAQAQAPAASAASDPFVATVAEAATTANITDEAATLAFANRQIVTLRATVLSRPPAVRAATATGLLHQLVEQTPTARVTARDYPDAILLFVDTRPVIAIMAADVDRLAGETLPSVAASAAATLQTAFDEAVELRTPARLVTPFLVALAATALYIVGMWGLIRLDRRVAVRLTNATERRLRNLPGGELMVGVAHAPAHVRRVFTVIGVLLRLFLTYAWLTVVLRRFPYTRPWGESLRSGLFSVAASAGGALLEQLPNLVTVLLIIVATRFVTRLTSLAFHAIEDGRVTIPWIYPETTQPTRRIVVAVMWLFALVVAYKYLPGSDSEVFKGVSVFVGLGSSCRWVRAAS